jgi:ABC-type multidrug transport system ATPase subunit
VHYNSAAAPAKAYAGLVGSVSGHPKLHQGLTVRENLEHSAAFRLPVQYSRQRKCAVVTDVLHLLGLSELQHCVVGVVGEAGWFYTCQCQ